MQSELTREEKANVEHAIRLFHIANRADSEVTDAHLNFFVCLLTEKEFQAYAERTMG